MSRAKSKGTAFETLIVSALQSELGDGVCRRTTSGAKDRGEVFHQLAALRREQDRASEFWAQIEGQRNE